MLRSCRGDYIALLDGDDYWTSPDKLQKQVDFLDRHPECAICFHSFTWLNYDRGRALEKYPPGRKSIYKLEDLLEFSFPFLTSFLMFRKELVGELPAWFHDFVFFRDWALGILASRHGDIGYINEVMGVYRVYSGGVWGGQGLIQQCVRACEFYEILKDVVDLNYHEKISVEQHKLYHRLAQEYIKENDLAKARIYVTKCAIGRRYCENASRLMVLKMLLRVYVPVLFKLMQTSKSSMIVRRQL